MMIRSQDRLSPCTDVVADETGLQELAIQRMPYGKYKGRLLINLPEPYLVWFSRNGFPPGKLGRQLETVYVIKVNGLEYLFKQV